MGEWKEVELAAIAVYVNRGVAPKYTDSTGVPVINQRCIRDGRIDSAFLKFHRADSRVAAEKTLRPHDILINSTGVGTAGRVAFWAEGRSAYVDSHVTILRLDQTKVNPKYVFYNLRQREDELEAASEGSTGQVELKREVIGSLELALPPRKHQDATVAILNSLEAKMELLRRQERTLTEMISVLFRQWFVEEAGEQWPWEQLGTHVEVLRGLSYNGSGLCEKGEGVPMHNLNSIYEGGGYKYDGVKYYKGEYKDRHIVLPGDVLVANTEQGHDQLLIGCPAIVPAYFGEAGIFSQHVYKLKLLNPSFSNVFVKQLLLSADVREQLTGSTNGSTVNMLPKDGIEMAKFQLPPKDKIQRFNAISAPLHQKQEKNYIQIQSLIAQRDTLLPKLMSGEVRVEETATATQSS